MLGLLFVQTFLFLHIYCVELKFWKGLATKHDQENDYLKSLISNLMEQKFQNKNFGETDGKETIVEYTEPELVEKSKPSNPPKH